MWSILIGLWVKTLSEYDEQEYPWFRFLVVWGKCRIIQV